LVGGGVEIVDVGSGADFDDDGDDDFKITKKAPIDDKKVNPKKPKAKKVDDNDQKLNKITENVDQSKKPTNDDAVVVEKKILTTNKPEVNTIIDESKKTEPTTIVEQEKKPAVKKQKAKKDDDDFKANKNDSENSGDSDSDYEGDSKKKGKKKQQASKTTKSKKVTNQPKQQQQLNDTIESVEVKKQEQKPFVNPTVKTIKNLNQSSNSSSPLGRIEIKSPAYMRVGLSRNSRVKPLHPNVKLA